MENKKIVSRHYYAVSVCLASPLNVSSGQDMVSDADVLRNKEGIPFIPGTSFAGAFRNYVMLKKNETGMMGYSKEQEGKMSSLFISDLYFECRTSNPLFQIDKTLNEEHHQIQTSLRDGVALTKEQTVKNKFDMEIVETGAKGILYFNFIVREEENEEEYKRLISSVLQGMQEGELRIGGKRTRGFGRFSIEQIYEKRFTKEMVLEWLEFEKAEKELSSYGKGFVYQDWIKTVQKVQAQYIKVSIPLRLTGGLSIRRYSCKPNEADYEQITCNGVSVIPGSTWAGVIRKDVCDILEMIGCKQHQIEMLCNQWFGYSTEKTQEQSLIVFGESKLQGDVRLVMTRNKIDRFDASTKEGALYTEISSFGGTTTLEILVKKDRKKDYLSLVGMLHLVIENIQKGYVAVGGQTAVGRGIFEADKERTVIWSELETESIGALYNLIECLNGGHEYGME